MELKHENNFTNLIVVLGRIQDRHLLSMVFKMHQPEVVLHAAAYKHVPLIEMNPWEAVSNNIIASRLLIEASILYRVECFLLVSTDKAVRPSNVMGASKRITEILMNSYSKKLWDRQLVGSWDEIIEDYDERLERLRKSGHNSRFMAVRFGNVLGSSGSVVPLFKRQIERGGPVTITHPNITRYFMSIEEAAQLILQAGSMGNEGEIFILKMGEPVLIDHMARKMIKLAGKTILEIPIIYTGLRPGEKLYEELIAEGEGIVPTSHNKILILKNNSNPTVDINSSIEQLVFFSQQKNPNKIKNLLKSVVIDYNPMN